MLPTNRRAVPLLAQFASYVIYDRAMYPNGWEDFDRWTLRFEDIADSGDKYSERHVGSSWANDVSAQRVLRLVRQYAQKMPLNSITIITPYSEQVKLIESLLKQAYRRDRE
jgi:hypothetical protein